ncbi:MAG: hypothetical protein ACYC9S_01615 [Leptospirales bacterium]
MCFFAWYRSISGQLDCRWNHRHPVHSCVCHPSGIVGDLAILNVQAARWFQREKPSSFQDDFSQSHRWPQAKNVERLETIMSSRIPDDALVLFPNAGTVGPTPRWTAR